MAAVFTRARLTDTSLEHTAPSSRESRARAAWENRYGRALSDAEWESTKRELLAFIELLRNWECGKAARNGGPASGKTPAGVLGES